MLVFGMMIYLEKQDKPELVTTYRLTRELEVGCMSAAGAIGSHSYPTWGTEEVEQGIIPELKSSVRLSYISWP